LLSVFTFAEQGKKQFYVKWKGGTYPFSSEKQSSAKLFKLLSKVLTKIPQIKLELHCNKEKKKAKLHHTRYIVLNKISEKHNAGTSGTTQSTTYAKRQKNEKRFTGFVHKLEEATERTPIGVIFK
jgi:hypothetical protein